MARTLPNDLTSYDFLKSLALLTMIVDHIGVYFFPDDLWLRAIGRTSLPIWMFLVGYASTRAVPPRLLIGGLILVAANAVVGMPILPLNILFGIAVTRLCLTPLMETILANRRRFWPAAVMLFLIVLPTYAGIEYEALLCGGKYEQVFGFDY